MVLGHHICRRRFHFLRLGVILIAVTFVAYKCLVRKSLRLQQQRLICVELVIDIVILGLVWLNADFEAFIWLIYKGLLDHFS